MDAIPDRLATTAAVPTRPDPGVPVTLAPDTPHGAPFAAFELRGRVALVTGGARNLGLGIAHTLAAAGAAVAVLGRSADSVAAAVAGIEAAGGTAHPVVADVADLSQHARIVEEVRARFGRLDILVNNAGVNPIKSLAEITEADYDQAHAANAKGPIFLSQAAFDLLAASGHASVINILSIGMWTGGPSLLLYRTSKLALYGATMVLAQDWASHGIRVNGIAPGMIGARMGGKAPDAATADVAAATPLGRRGTVDELANAVLYLAADASSFVTGSVLKVDGGKVTT